MKKCTWCGEKAKYEYIYLSPTFDPIYWCGNDFCFEILKDHHLELPYDIDNRKDDNTWKTIK